MIFLVEGDTTTVGANMNPSSNNEYWMYWPWMP